MTRPSTPPILSELRSPSSPASQVVALRALKNEIIGHEQKKEMWIGLGVVTPIARILNTHRSGGKRKHRDVTGSVDPFNRNASRTDEEEARLQAIIIVGSLAHGGPGYIAPLNAGSVFPPLLSILCPSESPPPLVLAALRSLNTVADSLALAHPTSETVDDGFLGFLYTEQHLASLAQIIDQVSPALIVQQQISLAAALVAKTCREDTQRKALAHVGVLDALATKLASFMLATGNSSAAPNGSSTAAPNNIEPATTRSKLSPILQAIATIISNSKLRTTQFVCAPAFAAVFPGVQLDSYAGKAAWGSSIGTSGPKRQGYLNSVDSLLPQLPPIHHRDLTSHTSNFPPLGTLGAWGKQARTSRGFSSALELVPTEAINFVEEDESALVAWLVHVVRAEHGVTRLMAGWVLTILYRSGLANKRRETGLALLLVPLLVRMLDKDFKLSSDMPASYDNSALQCPEWLITERASAVLAMLVVDSIDLQRAAVEAGAIKKLSQLLKQSYDPLPANLSAPLWTAYPQGSDTMGNQDNASVSKLGTCGVSPLASHVVRMRESVLTALAALATFEDDYRKAIIDNGVVLFVIESLKPYNSTASKKGSGHTRADGADECKEEILVSGNPTSVLLAACGAARALSRSVSTLRTSLIDADLAAPLFVLLKHQDIEVQVAATAVTCNLVLEFSPMRESFIESGILKILCEHAHSVNAMLRLNSVWALKHLVHTAPNSLKMSCLEELGPGWLKQIICNDTEDLSFHSVFRGDRDIGSGTPITMGTPNAAGEQVDLLNAVEEESTGSSQVADEDEEDEVNMIDSIGALSRPLTDHLEDRSSVSVHNKHPGVSEAIRQRLAAVHDAEIEFVNQARRDDLAVQEQGLDLIRNLICETPSSEMIDYIFRELGQDKVFDMLASKLRPKIHNAFSRERRTSESGVRQTPPPTEIVISVCYIIVHIAAGQPRHRQLLISQSELLKSVVALFNHPHPEVRVACAWLVINLTWADDQSDKLHCKSRAHELRKLGIYEKLAALESDAELDVRERVKTAIHQMSELLR